MSFLSSLQEKFLALSLAHKAALLTAGFSLMAMLVLILASHQGQQQLIDDSTELLGDSLVKQLSRDSSAALVQGDRLSLQSILNELVASPLIVRAAIYDLENRAVAEAGDGLEGKDLSASITFQDSIAGYAVVTFNIDALRGEASLHSWQLVALGLLLAALVFALALAPGRYLSAALEDLNIIAAAPVKQRPANTQIAYRGDDEINQLLRTLLQGPEQQAVALQANDFSVLVIEITNLPSLQVNLGQQALADALENLYQRLETVCRLYDGELQACRSHCYSMQFAAGGKADNFPFRAVCSAFLIEQLLRNTELPFQIRQGIANNDTALSRLEPLTGKQTTIERALLLAEANDEGILLSENVYLHPSVEGRLDCQSLEDGTFLARYLEQNYEQLLEQQLQSLQEEA